MTPENQAISGQVSANKTVSWLDQEWPWWPLLPLYPYGQRRTLVRELIPNQIWSFEQLQGLYYVAVPVRLTVVKVPGGLMLFNPLPPTPELRRALADLEATHGNVVTIVLPTASGLEHKLSLPAMARAFPQAEVWVCPGQWSFPISLPSSWLGIPARRTKVLQEDGFPHPDSCTWLPLGPLDLGLGRFEEVACFHRASGAVLVTDALVGIEAEPPALFDLDPTPLLFHARDRGDQPLADSPQARRRGWARVVLFATYLKPGPLVIPPLLEVLRNAFRPGTLSPKAHFGLFPFAWQPGWEAAAQERLGKNGPLLQVAPVLERLVFPRAKDVLLEWLDEMRRLKGMRWLVSAHFSDIVAFKPHHVRDLSESISKRPWAINQASWSFLGSVDQRLLSLGVVPKDPQAAFRD
ncbi:DUF4336 domain-containing protein [Prochlorococcus marinus]|uniref:DUF4336 domain-containing protein n=1 Tax=Prochlorococcus TaxID=1218 RepID=UPI0007B3C3FF|nr:DUF4336 domain-containing protein [Prochlorococcus marinus]KZR77327.1 hypothetical protein PMIT1323_00696 [Prochlorococcus marinus str. MIT 1323]